MAALDLGVSFLLAGRRLERDDQAGARPQSFTSVPCALARSPGVGAAGPRMITTRCRTSRLARVAWRHAGEPEKMGVVDIRAARMQDAGQIAVVHVRSWQAAYRGLLPQAYLDALDPAQRVSQWERIVPAAGPAGGGTLVADAGGRLAGFVSYGPARDDDADSRRAGEIYAIYLAPAGWDEETGRQLMAAALGRLGGAGSGQVILWALGSNTRARRFYEAGGWHDDGAVKHDDSFGVPVTEVRYRRSLP